MTPGAILLDESKTNTRNESLKTYIFYYYEIIYSVGTSLILIYFASLIVLYKHSYIVLYVVQEVIYLKCYIIIIRRLLSYYYDTVGILNNTPFGNFLRTFT